MLITGTYSPTRSPIRFKSEMWIKNQTVTPIIASRSR